MVPVKCFYVEVAEHHVLIDAGWSKAVASDPKGHLGFGLWFASEPVMEERQAAVNQLRGKKIDAILMTHLDCDHVSGLHDFSGYEIYTSAAELQYAREDRLRYGNLLEGLSFSTLVFKPDDSAPFGFSCDLFDDGSVVAYLTPTHSAGSVIYRITNDTGFALVVGDNGYREESWQQGLLPGPLHDPENMKKCLAWIKRMSEMRDCLGIYCAHDPIDR